MTDLDALLERVKQDNHEPFRYAWHPETGEYCSVCRVEWPCNTIQLAEALEAELERPHFTDTYVKGLRRELEAERARERVSVETVRWFVAKWGHAYELVEACDIERELIDRLATRLTSEVRERGVEVVE
jgi:hypothetical protein